MRTLITYALISCIPGLLGASALWLRRAPARLATANFIHYWTVCILAFYLHIPPMPWWASGTSLAIVTLLPVTLASGGKIKKFHALLYLCALVLGTLVSLLTHYLPILVRQGIIPPLT